MTAIWPNPNKNDRAALASRLERDTRFAQLARKDGGVYLTSDALADLVAELTLTPILEACDRVSDLAAIRILDPAVGTGAFLLAAGRSIRKRLQQLLPGATERRLRDTLKGIVDVSFVGIDIDANAAESARQALWQMCSVDEDVPNSFCEILTGDSLSRDFASKHYFDAILCNPPWGKIKPNVREYYGALDPDLRNSQRAGMRGSMGKMHCDHERLYDQYSRELIERAAELRTSDSFVMQKRTDGRRVSGDTELYRFFMDRIHSLGRGRSRIGLIVPMAFLNTEGASGIRAGYLSSGSFEHLLSFENRERLFDIHGMFRFTIAIYRYGGQRGVENAAFGLTNLRAARDSIRVVNPLSRHFLARFSPKHSIIPAVASSREKRLLEKLRKAFPTMRDPAGQWQARFVRECDMTNDAEAFVHATDIRPSKRMADGSIVAGRERFLAVYEGRLIDQYDAMAKAYLGGEGRRAKWKALDLVSKTLQPHYYMREQDALRLLGTRKTGRRAAFCDITGHANERTVLAAVVPSGAICGNKVPTLRFADSDCRLHLIWTAVANSVVVDWFVRRLVSTTLNYFYWDHVPFPFFDADSDDGRRIVGAVRALEKLGVDKKMSLAARQREMAALRALIDGVICNAFGLSDKEVGLILEDFPLIDDRSAENATRDLILGGLDAVRRSENPISTCRALSSRTPTPGYLRAEFRPT